MRCSASFSRIIGSPIFARGQGQLPFLGITPRLQSPEDALPALELTWLSRETASSASPRRNRRTSFVFRGMVQRSGRSGASAGGGSLKGVVVGFRALSFMLGLLGRRHRSPDDVQRNRV